MYFRKILKNFPVPKYIEMPCVGIDISPLSIRFIEIKNTKNIFTVGSFAREKLTRVFSIDQNDEARKEVQSILKKWKEEHKLHFIEANLPEEKVYLFKAEVPWGKEEEIRHEIEFTLEENVPIAPSEITFDYKVVGKKKVPEGEPLAEVIVTAIPTTIVESYITLFEEVGLVPVSFMVEGQALSKAIISKEDHNIHFIVNIGEIRTGIFVVCDGVVRFSSSIALGGHNFTEALMKQFGLNREEASKRKKTIGLSRLPQNEETFQALMNVASAFKEEIEKIYLYWLTHEGAQNITEEKTKKIVLSGKDALMNGLKEFIQGQLRVETEIGDVWQNIASFDEYIPPISAHEALDYGVAIGLALPKTR